MPIVPYECTWSPMGISLSDTNQLTNSLIFFHYEAVSDAYRVHLRCLALPYKWFFI